jgi:hypothetical protein
MAGTTLAALSGSPGHDEFGKWAIKKPGLAAGLKVT